MEAKQRKKSGKLSGDLHSDILSENDNSLKNKPEGLSYSPKERTKSRLRRHRSRGHSSHHSPSSAEDSDRPKRKSSRRKKRKKGKSSRATTVTGTTEESSEWTSRKTRSGIPTSDTRKREGKTKELSEKDLVEWMQKTVPYVSLESSLWNKWTLAPMHHFIRHANTLLCVAFLVDDSDIAKDTNGVLFRLSAVSGGNLIVFNKLIPEYSGELFYFLKAQPVAIDGLNYEEIVIFGNVPGGDQVTALNSLLCHYWTQIILNPECLPVGIQNDVFTELNTVACTSQTITHFLCDQTRNELFLYTPPELFLPEGGESETIMKSEHELASDKAFASRLEETMVYWITKLQQVLVLEELNNIDSWSGPLEEIQFWSSRSKNLKNILVQLKTRRMQKLLRITAISHSPYIFKLKSIFVLVSAAFAEACSNTHYLEPLRQPLEKLPKCALRQLRVEIQKILWLTLTIWRNAPYYNTPARLNGLLRKFSNALIDLCKSRLNVQRIFDGVNLPRKERLLKNCLKCLEWWREIYRLTEATHTSNLNTGTQPWIFDEDSIFVNVDTMVLRLQHLLEICQVQDLYRLKILPLFPGIKGPYISGVMRRCELLLSQKLHEMEDVSELVLNVTSTEWQEHMKGFRDTVMAIDMSVQNVLEESFEQMPNLKRKIELMQLFHRFYEKREVVTRQLDKLCVKLYEMFEQETLRLRKLFERKVVMLPITFSKLAGKGTWAELMKRGIESDLETLKKAEVWLPRTSGVGFQNMVKNEARALAEAMGVHAGKCYEEWAGEFQDLTSSMNREDHRGKLEVPLLIRGKGQLVKVNFDRSVYRNLTEAEMWIRTGRSLPPVLLMTVYPWREKLHGLRENVCVIAKLYNRCVSGLSMDEKLLFKDRLLSVEKKIYPCLTQSEWTWTTIKTADQTFLGEFRELTGGVLVHIKEYRVAGARIAEIIAQICKRKLVTVKTRGRRGVLGGIYEGLEEFKMEQSKKVEIELMRIVGGYKEIGNILKELFKKLFRGDGVEVRVQWGKYVNLVDSCLEEAIKLSCRESLKILEEAVGSEDRENPLFRVQALLEEGDLKFEPSLEELAKTLMNVHVMMAKGLEPVARLGKFLGAGKAELGAFKRGGGYCDAVLGDEETVEIRNRLGFEVERCLSEVNLYAERWIPYRDIWEVGREEFMENYEKQYPDIAAYEKDLKRYTEISEIVHGGDSMVTIRWLQIDCGKLKEGIAEESMEWFRVLAGNLYSNAKDKLLSAYGYMEENEVKLGKEPENLEEQLELWKMAQSVRGEVRQKLVATFPAIHERFRLLKKYGFGMEGKVEEMEEGLEGKWRKHLRFLKETDEKLEKSHERMKRAFLEEAENLKRKADQLQKLWEREGPFSREAGKEVEMQLENFGNEVKGLKQEEKELNEILETFNLKKEKNLVLVELETDIEWLSEVWKQVEKWERQWAGWKAEKIEKVDVQAIGKGVENYLEGFRKLNKQFEVKSWRVIGEMLEFIEVVQKSLNCCLFLRGHTLQQRHWEWIREMVHKQCHIEPDSIPLTPEQWTLNMVVSFQLEQFLGPISEISWSSEKEMAVEQTLEKIEEFWENENFLLKKRRKVSKSAAIIFELDCSSSLQDNLMDHIVSLTAMKGSQFVGIFQEKVDFWEASLQIVDEVLELLLLTQHEWLVLDRIFTSEHIQKEMPGTARQFSVVTSVWASVLLIVTQVRNILKMVTETENISEMLQDLRERMSGIKNEMKVYLQGIRQEFPRFYLVPDEQLLECLGGSQEIENYFGVMQKVFGNFGNISLLETEEGQDMRVITSVISKDNLEVLKLCNSVVMDTEPVESWFGMLEESIKLSVRENMGGCRDAWGGNWNKLEDWLLGADQWTLQSMVAAVKIQWTADVSMAIEQRNTGNTSSDGGLTLKKVTKRLKKSIDKIVGMLKEIGNVPRKKLITRLEGIVITLLYLKDVTERLRGRNCGDLESFEWLQYLRWYWNGIGSSFVVRQGFTSIPYGWEYCEGDRAFGMVTPITERCFLAMTTAIGLQMGAVIHGDWDSGKRETIKGLGYQLGKFLVNLRLEYNTDMDTLCGVISGIVQSGVWAVLQGVENCRAEVVHLLETKLALITKVKLARSDYIMLDGVGMTLHTGCGIFAVMSTNAWTETMERDSLASLKRVMRPVALIQPDAQKLLEVKLFLAGFENCAGLAGKIENVFRRGKECFPYFGNVALLSNMIATASKAVDLKMTHGKKMNEGEAVIKALEIVIVPGLKNSEDKTRFQEMVKTYFPMEQADLVKVKVDYRLEYFIRQSFEQLGYEISEKMVVYCMRLHELIKMHKAIVILGETGTGKSVIRRILRNALNLRCQQQQEELNDETENDFASANESLVKEFIVNPATVEGASNLFGESNRDDDKGQHKWNDGIVTNILRSSQMDNGQLWLVFDGPLENQWIPDGIRDLYKNDAEICVANCERVFLNKKITTFFETDTLRNVSPGLISSCGVLFIEGDKDEGKEQLWKLHLKTRLTNLKCQIAEEVQGYAHQVLEKCVIFRMTNLSGLIPGVGSLQLIEMFAGLLETFTTEEILGKLAKMGTERCSLAAKQIVAFCITWSVFAGLDHESQQKASAFLKDSSPFQQLYPAKRIIFEYFLDLDNQKWLTWEKFCAQCSAIREISGESSYNDFINTVDTTKAQYLVQRFQTTADRKPVLVCGPKDSGKSQLVASVLKKSMPGNQYKTSDTSVLSIQVTPNMKASSIQRLMECQLETVSSFCLSPSAGRKLTVFVDDINASASETHVTSSSSSEEFFRCLLDHWMWYDQETRVPTAISNVSIIATMSAISSDTNSLKFEISSRLQRRFCLVYLPRPDDLQLRKIFTQKIVSKFQDFAPPVKLLADGLTVATLDVYKEIQTEIQPLTPFHVYSLSDISRVYNGLFRSHKDSQDTKLSILRLWFHECSRIFQDRLTDPLSQNSCQDILEKQLIKHFEISPGTLFPSRSLYNGDPINDLTVFGNFMKTSKCYEEVKNVVSFRTMIEDKMGVVTGGRNPTVLFQEAVLQVAKISRVLSERKGHLIIFGSVGQGRETLTRVAAELYQYKIFKMPISANVKNNPVQTFLEMLKSSYISCATENIGCCVLLKDEQVSEEILDYVSIATSTVEIPGLFTKKEVTELFKRSSVKDSMLVKNAMKWMKCQVEKHLHVILYVKPDTQFLKNIEEKFSGLLKRMTVSRFDIWTQMSYNEAAQYLLKPSTKRDSVDSSVFYSIHKITADAFGSTNGSTKITAMHFTDFVELYKWYRIEAKEAYAKKRKLLQSAIQEIKDVRSQISNLTDQAQVAERKAEAARVECSKMLTVIQKQEHDTIDQDSVVKELEGQLEEEIKEYEELAAVIKQEWSEALGDFEKETEVLQDLADDDLTHIRSYFSPPPLVARVLDAVMIMLDREQSWPEAKIQLGHPGFIKSISEYDKARISMEKLNNLKKFLQNKEFTPEAIAKYSNGARIMCAWIHAIEKYGRCYLSKICPKREKLESSERQIIEHKHTLLLASEKLQLLTENLTELKTVYDGKWLFKESLEEDAKKSSDILDRANSVLNLLEQDSDGISQRKNYIKKWKESLVGLEEKVEELEGNAVMCAAFLAYAGCFGRETRRKLKATWKQAIETEAKVKVGNNWKLEDTLNFENLVVIRERIPACLQAFHAMRDKEDLESEWMLENLVLVKKSRRPVLSVDLYGLQKLENVEKILEVKKVEELLVHYHSTSLESEQKGIFVTKEICLENVDARISSRFTIVDCTPDTQGLTNYFMLQIANVVSPENEARRRVLVQNALACKLKVDDLMEKIPRLVISCGGASILNNGSFPHTLSKWEAEIQETEMKLSDFENQISEIETNRHRFLYPAAAFTRLFGSINLMTRISPFYQISLTFFTGVMQKMCNNKFPQNQQASEEAEKVKKEQEEKVIDFLEGETLLKLFELAAMSMQRKHCFQFSLLFCIKTLVDEARNEKEKSVLETEIALLLTTSSDENFGNDKENYESMKKLSWIMEAQGKAIYHLNALKEFQGLRDSIFVKESNVWKPFFTECSETDALFPESWNSRLNPFQKLILIFKLRPDLFPNQVVKLTETVLGAEYAQILKSSRLTDLKQIYNDPAIHVDSCATSIIFFMNTQQNPAISNPRSSVEALATAQQPPAKFYSLSLSPRNAQLSTKLLNTAATKGQWVYLDNCQLNNLYLYELEQFLKLTCFHRNFKLWLCTKSCSNFPQHIAQSSIKVAVEAPFTFSTSMKRLHQKMQDYINSTDISENLKQLIYGLCYLHCKLQEKVNMETTQQNSLFLPILLDSDFEVALSILQVFTEKYQHPVSQFPWWALKYMLELQYGNHYTTNLSRQSFLQQLQRVFSAELFTGKDLWKADIDPFADSQNDNQTISDNNLNHTFVTGSDFQTIIQSLIH